MEKIEAAQFIGKWRSFKTHYKDKERKEDGRNWAEWTFWQDGKAKFFLSKDNIVITDHIDRFWTLSESHDQDTTTFHLNINDKSEYEIISVEKLFLVLKCSNGIIYHFAEISKWYDVIR